MFKDSTGALPRVQTKAPLCSAKTKLKRNKNPGSCRWCLEQILDWTCWIYLFLTQIFFWSSAEQHLYKYGVGGMHPVPKGHIQAPLEHFPEVSTPPLPWANYSIGIGLVSDS